MKLRTVIPIVIALLIAAGGLTLYAWISRPKIIEISPPVGMVDASSASSVRLVFSRLMDHASVASHLVIEPANEGALSWQEDSLVFTPAQPWPAGEDIHVSLTSGARAAAWLAFPLPAQSWSFGTRFYSLAYLWPSSGAADIYTVDPMSKAIHRYTQGMGVLEYTASRDGKWFYFSAGNAQGGTDLYRLDRIRAEDPSQASYQPEELLNCRLAQCRNPAVSADDQSLAYEYLLPTPSGSSGPAQVWVLILSNLAASPVGQPGHETVEPAWSAAGKLAYYDRTNSAYEVFDLRTQLRVQLPNQTGQPGAWSADGNYYLAPEISYLQSAPTYETASSHLIRFQVADGAATDISSDGEVEDVDGVYSPAGNAIAFTRKYLDAERWSPGRQVWVMGADGSGAVALTNDADYNHYGLAWSLDGSRLAYVRFNQVKISDPPELWMVDRDGSNPLQLVIGGYSPVWIH